MSYLEVYVAGQRLKRNSNLYHLCTQYNVRSLFIQHANNKTIYGKMRFGSKHLVRYYIELL